MYAPVLSTACTCPSPDANPTLPVPNFAEPLTSSRNVGVAVPIPTLPLPLTSRIEAEAGELTRNNESADDPLI